MTKIRNLEIENKDNSFYFKIDGKEICFSSFVTTKNEFEECHNTDENKEIIEMILQELNLAFNLTDEEIREYKKTLEYILED